MYHWLTSDDGRILQIRHTGEYVDDEGNVSLLEVLQHMSAEDLSILDVFIRNTHAVTAASLKNTDRAQQEVYKRKVTSVLQAKGLSTELLKLKFFFILPEKEVISLKIQERMRRTISPWDVVLRPVYYPSLEEALQDLKDYSPVFSGAWRD